RGRGPPVAGGGAVGEAAGQPPGKAEPIVDRLQQHGPAVAAGLRLVEAGYDRLGNTVDPQGTVRYTGCGHRASACSFFEAPRHRFYSTYAWLGGSSLSSFVNFPG